MTMKKLALSMSVTALLAAAACGGGSSKAPTGPTATTFNDEANKTVKCMVHQAKAPAPLDKPGATEQPADVLSYLRYYTANGNKPYCDGKPATSIDREWLSLYVAAGSSRSNISAALRS